MTSFENQDIRRKRLLHRARYRGCLESDLLMGRFAGKHLGAFNLTQLDRFEALLDEPDHDILAWIGGREPVPERHNNDVFLKLMTFDVANS